MAEMLGPNLQPNPVSKRSKIEAYPATVEDIFADIETLVALVPDERERESLQAARLNMQKEYQRAYAEGEEKREKWEDDWLDDIRNPEKIPTIFPDGQKPYQRAYQVMQQFVESITPQLEQGDTQSKAAAHHIATFCFEMCVMLQSFGRPDETYPKRIKERFKSYYTTGPVSLKLAKLKRLAQPADVPDPGIDPRYH